jgi:hypothetical protein
VASYDTFDFFEKRLNISTENMLIRINSADTDLIEMVTQRYGNKILEIDTKPLPYYKHKIGVKGVMGRSFNLAIRNPNSNEFYDIGNFIIHTYNNKQYFTEIGFGTTTILKELYGLDHVQDCTPVIGLVAENETIKRKFEDAIVTCTVLFREGLNPFTRDNRSRILKQYLRSISYFRAKSGISKENLLHLINNFETREFPDSSEHSANNIIKSLSIFEENLLIKTRLSDNEKKIKNTLKEMYI